MKARFQKIFSNGKVYDQHLYKRLQKLDAAIFFNCGNEFKNNRTWWVCVKGLKIVAYCGMTHSDGFDMFNRAWVSKDYRGNGWQRQMIKLRLRFAKQNKVITYTLPNNLVSANNLIKCGFLLYSPAYAWVGSGMLYFVSERSQH